MYISKSTAKKILKEAGATRISDEALAAFYESINKIAYEIAGKSVSLAKHAKRKTLEPSDIKLASS
ncbi:MAG: histone [Candidatus Micrarchaeia archaeon]